MYCPALGRHAGQVQGLLQLRLVALQQQQRARPLDRELDLHRAAGRHERERAGESCIGWRNDGQGRHWPGVLRPRGICALLQHLRKLPGEITGRRGRDRRRRRQACGAAAQGGRGVGGLQGIHWGHGRDTARGGPPRGARKPGVG